jgi:hypothetical protein
MEDRLKAATFWLLTGSFEDAAKQTDIPVRTIREWSYQPWWNTLVEEAKTGQNKELDAGFTSIIHTCVEQMKERLVNGNEQMTKIGLVRVKPRLKELSDTIAILTDRRAKIRVSDKVPVQDTNKETGLDELAQALSQDKK